MSKIITIVMPDNYNVENAMVRINSVFYDMPVKVTAKTDISSTTGEILLLIGEFQQKLKELTS